MTKQELLNELNVFKEDVIEKITTLEKAINNIKDNDNDILSKYKSAIYKEAYWLDTGDGITFNDKDSHCYSIYPVRDYAERA